MTNSNLVPPRSVGTPPAPDSFMSQSHDTVPVVPLRHPGRWIGAALMIFVLLSMTDVLVTNDRWQWDKVAQYMFSAPILNGVMNTLILTVLAEIVGITFGILLAVMRLSENPLLSWSSAVFTWVFRGIPPLVLVLFIYFLSALVPVIAIGIPFGPSLPIADTNDVITRAFAAVVGLGLAQAAYVAEIMRAGILSVSPGQTHAALAMGMTPLQSMRYIVFPQAMRVVVPPLSNEVIAMVKNTSLVSVIAYFELLTTVQVIYARTFEQIPLLMVAVIWYVIITSVLTAIQSWVERSLNRSAKTRKVQA